MALRSPFCILRLLFGFGRFFFWFLGGGIALVGPFSGKTHLRVG